MNKSIMEEVLLGFVLLIWIPLMKIMESVAKALSVATE